MRSSYLQLMISSAEADVGANANGVATAAKAEMIENFLAKIIWPFPARMRAFCDAQAAPSVILTAAAVCAGDAPSPGIPSILRKNPAIIILGSGFGAAGRG